MTDDLNYDDFGREILYWARRRLPLDSLNPTFVIQDEYPHSVEYRDPVLSVRLRIDAEQVSAWASSGDALWQVPWERIERFSIQPPAKETCDTLCIERINEVMLHFPVPRRHGPGEKYVDLLTLLGFLDQCRAARQRLATKALRS